MKNELSEECKVKDPDQNASEHSHRVLQVPGDKHKEVLLRTVAENHDDWSQQVSDICSSKSNQTHNNVYHGDQCHDEENDFSHFGVLIELAGPPAIRFDYSENREADQGKGLRKEGLCCRYAGVGDPEFV